MKYITLIALAAMFSLPAEAGKHFMPLKPADHTLIHGKKFMALGGGKDPIRLEKEKRDYFSLRKQFASLTPMNKTPQIAPEPEIATDETIIPTNADEIEQMEAEALPAELPAEEPNPALTREKILEELQPLRQAGLQHIWPVDKNVKSVISSPFGYRTHPITGKYAFHAGLDIAAPIGSAVIASERGEVSEVGRHKNLGKYVKISHEDGSYSLYGHLSKAVAYKGMPVKQGEKIGEVGNTGRSTGPHLDYSLRKDGKPVDPLKYLTRSDTQQLAATTKN